MSGLASSTGKEAFIFIFTSISCSRLCAAAVESWKIFLVVCSMMRWLFLDVEEDMYVQSVALSEGIYLLRGALLFRYSAIPVSNDDVNTDAKQQWNEVLRKYF